MKAPKYKKEAHKYILGMMEDIAQILSLDTSLDDYQYRINSRTLHGDKNYAYSLTFSLPKSNLKFQVTLAYDDRVKFNYTSLDSDSPDPHLEATPSLDLRKELGNLLANSSNSLRKALKDLFYRYPTTETRYTLEGLESTQLSVAYGYGRPLHATVGNGVVVFPYKLLLD